ncbi:MAG: hypothetical protein ABIO57_04200 [Candidatus Paceibacterota bacterium]
MKAKEEMLMGLIIILFVSVIMIFCVFSTGDTTQMVQKKDNDHVTRYIIDYNGDNKADQTVINDATTGTQTTTTPSTSDQYYFDR